MTGAPRKSKTYHDMQDGLLAWYKSQAALSDVEVERKIDSEKFDFREKMRGDKKKLVTTKRK